MIDDFFKIEKSFIEEELERYFQQLNRNEKDTLLKDFLSQLEEFIRNPKAKRIHPVLLIAAFTGIINPMYLEDQINEIRKVSLAVELLHSGYIIHDDLIDNDDKRRGKPAFHEQLKNEISSVLKGVNIPNKENIIELYGRDMSILGSVQGYLLGLDILKSSKFPDKLKLLAINEYTLAMDFLMKGQIIEEYMDYHKITMSLEQYLNMAELQRASLFEKSTRVGAILAKGNLHYQIEPLSKAMINIGQAHAIRDDLLDLEDDIKRKKKRIIYLLAIQNSDEIQSKTLNEIYTKENLTNNDVKIINTIFAETHAVVIAEHLSKNLISQAKTFLKDIYPDLNRDQKFFFNEFSDYIYLREL
jgi:geranylgeranyl diphosphate synthase type I